MRDVQKCNRGGMHRDFQNPCYGVDVVVLLLPSCHSKAEQQEHFRLVIGVTILYIYIFIRDRRNYIIYNIYIYIYVFIQSNMETHAKCSPPISLYL